MSTGPEALTEPAPCPVGMLPPPLLGCSGAAVLAAGSSDRAPEVLLCLPRRVNWQQHKDLRKRIPIKPGAPCLSRACLQHARALPPTAPCSGFAIVPARGKDWPALPRTPCSHPTLFAQLCQPGVRLSLVSFSALKNILISESSQLYSKDF